MGVQGGSITTDIIKNGLVFNMDAANRASTIPSTSTTEVFNTIDTAVSGAFSADAQYDSSTITPSFAFDGTGDSIVCSNVNSLSFTDGSNDLPFSVSVWVYMVDATKFRPISKVSSAGYEWLFIFDSSNRLRWRLHGNNNVNKRMGIYSSALTSYENQWVNLIGTYNGNETHSGLKMYLNGASISTTDYSLGTYNGMQNTSADVFIGFYQPNSTSSNGNIGPIQIYNRALSANEVLHNYNALKGRFGL